MGRVRYLDKEKPMKGEVRKVGKYAGQVKTLDKDGNFLSLSLTKSIKKYIPWRKYKF